MTTSLENCYNFYMMMRILILIIWCLSPSSIFASDSMPENLAGFQKEEVLKMGEKMYRQGILPSGATMEAIVQNDIPVDSTMFTCVSCHLRSGKGSLEGQVLTFPIDGITLYRPLSYSGSISKSAQKKFASWIKSGDFRRAYTDASLATAIRGGVDPDGRTLNNVMPRYPLDDRDMDILVFYLKNLSVEPSPGVTDKAMHFATIITEEVSQADREAMIAPLELLANNWGKSRRLVVRAKRVDLDEEMNRGFRNLSLARWVLKGPPSGWRDQLEDYYRKDPVFALLGGISTGDWYPIHEFCEQKRIPCIFPITEFPVVSDSDWYSLYFSKGLYQEGETAAKYLHDTANMSEDLPVIQVYRNSRRALALARGFQETWTSLGHQEPEKQMFSQEQVITKDFWKKLAASHNHAIILIWLDAKDISSIDVFSQAQNRPKMIFMSSALLGDDMYSLSERVRSLVYITYPYRLPHDYDRQKAAVANWLQNNKIPATNLNIESNMYFVHVTLSRALMMLKSDFYRDRFLELVDMMMDSTTAAAYPRLSFGPGQRYASKGCYIVQLTDGAKPDLIRVSDWVIP